MKQNDLNQRIEAMCQQGCEAVRSYIKAMEQDLPLEQLNGLDRLARSHILEELKAIMAVYDQPNRD